MGWPTCHLSDSACSGRFSSGIGTEANSMGSASFRGSGSCGNAFDSSFSDMQNTNPFSRRNPMAKSTIAGLNLLPAEELPSLSGRPHRTDGLKNR
jgi:hypothetical protein